MMPMFGHSRFAPLWGGVAAPVLWTGLVWASLDVLNPALNARVDWVWFVVSQVAFGLTAGFVIARTQKIETMQTWPLAARAGLKGAWDQEAPAAEEHE
jgi:flagellar biosynthesis protein FliR